MNEKHSYSTTQLVSIFLVSFFVFTLYSFLDDFKSDTFIESNLIWSSKKQPKFNSDKPIIYYTPHQDDETLAMGASIAESARKGKTVYVVLMTNGKNEGIKAILNGEVKCNFHDTFHHFNLTDTDVIHARNLEFIAACKRLGAHKVFISNNGQGYDESIGLDSMSHYFFKTMEFFANQFPEAKHNTISGNCDSYDHEGHRVDAHRACANALQLLYNQGKTKKINLYRDYIFYFPVEQRHAGINKKLNKKDIKKRQKACDEYNYYNPVEGRYAIGYQHSVWDLFNNSYSSTFEYVDTTQVNCPK